MEINIVEIYENRAAERKKIRRKTFCFKVRSYDGSSLVEPDKSEGQRWKR